MAPFWPQRPWLPDLFGSGSRRSNSVAVVHIFSVSFPLSSSRDPQAVSSCLATVQLFARAEGFSSRLVSHGELFLIQIIKLNGCLADNGVVRKDILFFD